MKSLMIKILSFLLIVSIAGCATPTNKFVGEYNDAVAAGHTVVIVKEGDFATTKEGVDMQLTSIGYNKIFYTSPTEFFEVLVKDISYGNPMLNGDAKSQRIFLKYTKIDAGHTRIDLVNAGTNDTTKAGIDQDIQKLAASIKEN